MAAPDRDDMDALAGEYVLGTLDPEERRAAAARMAADAAFRAAVHEWEDRLQPLDDSTEPAIPPSGLFARIEARIDASAPPPAESANVVSLRRSVRRWRVSTALAGAATAAVLAFVVVDRVSAPVPQREFVAVLTADGAAPAFVAAVDLGAGTLSIRRITGEQAPPDSTYELWAVAPDSDPRSLGLVRDASFVSDLPLAGLGELTLAISVEPEGGSPTGQPTGPVVFSGRLVAPD